MTFTLLRPAPLALLALTASLSAPALAQTANGEPAAGAPAAAEDREQIVVTATRSALPKSALPLTIDVIGGERFTDQVSISGSVIDAVAALGPVALHQTMIRS